MALQSTNVSSIRMCFSSGRLNLDVRQSKTWEDTLMREYMAVVERDPETALYVGYVPGFPGAHSQGATLDELNRNLKEVIEMLIEDGEPHLEGEFIGTQRIAVG